jgi:hypothetical protein
MLLRQKKKTFVLKATDLKLKFFGDEIKSSDIPEWKCHM